METWHRPPAPAPPAPRARRPPRRGGGAAPGTKCVRPPGRQVTQPRAARPAASVLTPGFLAGPAPASRAAPPPDPARNPCCRPGPDAPRPPPTLARAGDVRNSTPNFRYCETNTLAAERGRRGARTMARSRPRAPLGSPRSLGACRLPSRPLRQGAPGRAACPSRAERSAGDRAGGRDAREEGPRGAPPQPPLPAPDVHARPGRWAAGCVARRLDPKDPAPARDLGGGRMTAAPQGRRETGPAEAKQSEDQRSRE